MSKKPFNYNNNFIDTATGEIVATEKSFISRKESEPRYVKVYLDGIDKMKDMQGRTIHILLRLLRLLDYEQIINISYGQKVNICEELQIKTMIKGVERLAVDVVDKHLRILVDNGVLYRIQRGQYLANPWLFGKGKWDGVEKIRQTVDYDDAGVMIMTDIKK